MSHHDTGELSKMLHSVGQGGGHRAEELYHWGMIHRLVEPEDLLAAAHQLARELLAKSPRAVTAAKLTVNSLAAVAAREINSFDPDLFIHRGEPEIP